MPSKKPTLKAYVTPDQYARISDDAERAGLSVSEYIKRICLGQPTPSLENKRTALDLIKINADLGRLGGLFKLCLSDKERGLNSLHAEVRRVLREIEARQRELKAAVGRI